MTFEEEIFGTAIPEKDLLKKYGFEEINGKFSFKTSIFDEKFVLFVKIEQKNIETELIENEFNEPYILYKNSNVTGEFNGKIREEIEKVLLDIKEKCFDNSVFESKAAKQLVEFAKQKYGDEMEFLWKKFPDNAILRRKDTKKWYAVFGKVNLKKLGIDKDKLAEIAIIRGKQSDIDEKNILPAWHMNKKNWITILLDENIDTETMLSKLTESYNLAIK